MTDCGHLRSEIQGIVFSNASACLWKCKAGTESAVNQ